MRVNIVLLADGKALWGSASVPVMLVADFLENIDAAETGEDVSRVCRSYTGKPFSAIEADAIKSGALDFDMFLLSFSGDDLVFCVKNVDNEDYFVRADTVSKTLGPGDAAIFEFTNKQLVKG